CRQVASALMTSALAGVPQEGYRRSDRHRLFFRVPPSLTRRPNVAIIDRGPDCGVLGLQATYEQAPPNPHRNRPRLDVVLALKLGGRLGVPCGEGGLTKQRGRGFGAIEAHVMAFCGSGSDPPYSIPPAAIYS